MKENITTFKKSVLLSLVSMLLLFGFTGLNAQICVPTSTYNDLSWTWSYYAPCSTTYNCLSYALDITSSWTWPWSSNPNSAQVDSYLSGRGYATTGITAKIVSYGPSSSSIAHFSKIINSSTVRAKCGGLNVLTHNSWNPYYSYTTYGSQRTVYYKKMSVYISGPRKCVSGTNYTWCANVSEGVPPYTYSWDFKSGTTSCVTGRLSYGEDLNITVMVTGADGRSAYGDCYVINMDPGNPLAMGAAMRENEISKNLATLLNDENVAGNTSSNPYDYINNPSFQQLVQMGPKALLGIRQMIRQSEENGLKEYLLAIVAEEIARVNLKGDTFAWTNGAEWSLVWDKHIKALPQIVADIMAADLAIADKNSALIKLGTPAIPFILDEMACGNTQYKPALKALTKGTDAQLNQQGSEDIGSWATRNNDYLVDLREISDFYRNH